ncbi:MAG TPA: ABC transporter permease [Planctomycetota bacterium]|nr:ABC transporter permease [Planctomycetota bacterium]
MKLWSAAACLARKDLGLYFRDRTGMLLGILLPIALVTVFGMVMKFAFGGDSGMPKVELWITDEDGSDGSRRFVDELRAVPMLSVLPKPGEDAPGAAALRAKVVDGEAHHALIVGAGYGAALAAGREPPLTLVQDPGRSMESRLIGIGLMQATMAAAEGQAMPWLLGSILRRNGMSEQGVERVRAGMDVVQGVIDRYVDGSDPALRTATSGAARGAFDMASLFEDMVPVAKENVTPPDRPKNLGYQLAQSVAGMTVMMLMFGLMACSSTLLQERDQGTLRRLLVSRAPRQALLLGKFLFCFCIGMLQLLILFGYGELLFGVGTFRDPATLLVLSATWSAAATSFGMLIAVWARTQKQAEGLSTMLILVMAALGGCWFPLQIADLPWYAEVVTKATLTHWAMTGFQGMFWHQKAFTDPVLLRAIAVQWGFVIVAALAAWRLWLRRFVGG